MDDVNVGIVISVNFISIIQHFQHAECMEQHQVNDCTYQSQRLLVRMAHSFLKKFEMCNHPKSIFTLFIELI